MCDWISADYDLLILGNNCGYIQQWMIIGYVILHRVKVIYTGGKMLLGMAMHEELWEKYFKTIGSKVLLITMQYTWERD